tara:strand:+ start:508 stop:711 length:204 start_codon:yes stop_codon:yes gene_type:complete
MEETINDLLEKSEKIFQEINKLKKTIDISELYEDDPVYQKYVTLDIASDHIWDGYTYLELFKKQIKG